MNEPKKDEKTSSPFAGPLMDSPDPSVGDEPESGDLAREAAQIAGLQAEIAELKDRYLRSVAETENVRRRADREKTEAAQFAFTRFAKDLLNVVDNFSRAVDALTLESRAALPPNAKSVIEGVEATQRELLSIFERHGIRRIDAKSQRFDPHLHRAIAEIPTSDHQPGTVIDVAQHGYMIGGRLLREAMVTVAAQAPRNGNNGEAPGSSIDTTA